MKDINKRSKDHKTETIHVKCLPRTLRSGKVIGKQFYISFENFIEI